MYKTQVQMDQRPQQKSMHTEPHKKEKNSLEYIDTGDYFLNITPVAQTQKLTINKWNLLKLKSFSKTKGTVNKTKWQATEWEKNLHQPHI